MAGLNSIKNGLRTVGRILKTHSKFIGPGVISSVAYMDPGNFSVDIQGGAGYGYKLLFVILMAGLGAIVVQVMATRLGVVTGIDLAAHTRLLLYDRPKHTKFFRVSLWILYIAAEIAIIATDLAELLGSAIALNLLFPRLPLWAGVLITAVDVLIVLIFFQRDEAGRKGMRVFEALIVCLVLAVFVCFFILVVRVNPIWPEVFLGYVPSKTVFGPGALYTSVGIIGATVMPHALFIGSKLSTIDRLEMLPTPAPPPPMTKLWKLPGRNLMEVFPKAWQDVIVDRRLRRRHSAAKPHATIRDDHSTITLEELTLDIENGGNSSSSANLSQLLSPSGKSQLGTPTQEVEESTPPLQEPVFNRLEFIKSHITHATWDIILSLVTLAVTINSAILVIGGTAFFYRGNSDAASNADLFGTYDLLMSYVGSGPALLFALALLCSAQSASITATLAGQVVSSGFIDWKTSPFVRRMATRLISMVPSLAIAAGVGRPGIDTLLVASQVILSLILPTVIFPLVYLCHSDVMLVRPARTQETEENDMAVVSFKSPIWLSVLGYLLFGIICLANAYVIVTLCLGQT